MPTIIVIEEFGVGEWTANVQYGGLSAKSANLTAESFDDIADQVKAALAPPAPPAPPVDPPVVLDLPPVDPPAPVAAAPLPRMARTKPQVAANENPDAVDR